MKKGKVPSAQSAAALTAARAYVIPCVGPADKHLFDAGWLIQNSDTFVRSAAGHGEERDKHRNLPGVHWNVTKKK